MAAKDVDQASFEVDCWSIVESKRAFDTALVAATITVFIPAENDFFVSRIPSRIGSR